MCVPYPLFEITTNMSSLLFNGRISPLWNKIYTKGDPIKIRSSSVPLFIIFRKIFTQRDTLALWYKWQEYYITDLTDFKKKEVLNSSVSFINYVSDYSKMLENSSLILLIKQKKIIVTDRIRTRILLGNTP